MRLSEKSGQFWTEICRSFRVLEVVNSNLIIDIEDEKATVNLDQVRIYKFRNDNEFSGMLSGKSQLPWTRRSLFFFFVSIST